MSQSRYIGKFRGSELVEELLSGASLGCVMRPDDEIPTNRPLHDECFSLPHIVVDGENFSAITGQNIVTRPGVEWPIVFYYTNYKEMFGTFDPLKAEPGVTSENLLRVSFAPRKRYKKFEWLVRGTCKKIWDSQGKWEYEPVRLAVHRAVALKVVFLDEEDIWNIHPVILPQVACNEDSFLLQAGSIAYPQFFRDTRKIETVIDNDNGLWAYLEEEKRCFTQAKELRISPFHAFYHLYNNGTYKSYYDLARGDTMHEYKRLMVFAEE